MKHYNCRRCFRIESKDGTNRFRSWSMRHTTFILHRSYTIVSCGRSTTVQTVCACKKKTPRKSEMSKRICWRYALPDPIQCQIVRFDSISRLSRVYSPRPLRKDRAKFSPRRSLQNENRIQEKRSKNFLQQKKRVSVVDLFSSERHLCRRFVSFVADKLLMLCWRTQRVLLLCVVHDYFFCCCVVVIIVVFSQSALNPTLDHHRQLLPIHPSWACLHSLVWLSQHHRLFAASVNYWPADKWSFNSNCLSWARPVHWRCHHSARLPLRPSVVISIQLPSTSELVQPPLVLPVPVQVRPSSALRISVHDASMVASRYWNSVRFVSRRLCP